MPSSSKKLAWFCVFAALFLGAGECPPPAEETDGGETDAAQADAGTQDAAQPDSTVPDSSRPDSSVPDTSQPDAAVPDSAVADSAVTDSAIADAAQPDTTATDAAEVDSAQPDAGGTDAGPIDPSLLSFLDAWCAKDIRCQDSWGVNWSSHDVCVQSMRSMFECGYHMTWFTDYATTELLVRYDYNQTAGEACIPWLASADCTDDTDHYPDDCADAFGWSSFTAAAGESCFDAWCGAELYCPENVAMPECPVCTAKPGVGEACGDDPYVPCDADSYCNDSGQCVAEIPIGNACTVGEWQCDGYCIEGTCSAGRLKGESCETVDEEECAYHLVCLNEVCADRVAADGACEGTEYCQGGLVCADGLCKPVDLCNPGGAGSPCMMECAAGAYCDFETYTCMAESGLNEPCSSFLGGCVEGTYCDFISTNTCQSLLANGGTCYLGTMCQSGYCDTDNYQCADAVACVMP